MTNFSKLFSILRNGSAGHKNLEALFQRHQAFELFFTLIRPPQQKASKSSGRLKVNQFVLVTFNQTRHS